MNLNLPNNVISKQDLQSVILEIRKYAQWYSQTTVKQQVSNNVPSDQPIITPEATDIVKNWDKDQPINQESLDKLINELSEIEETSPQITFTLAAVPPNTLKKDLANWCRKNINQNALVNFKFNATILGGMVVNYGSHVFDWSFKRQIISKRQHFPEILRNV